MFIVICGVLGYELYMFKRENKKKLKPVVPKFDEKKSIKAQQAKVLVSAQKTQATNSSRIVLYVLIILVVIIGGTTFFALRKVSEQTVSTVTPSQAPTLSISSKGIHLFSETFEPLSDQAVAVLPPGTSIVVGIYTIPNSDIDMARIRLNKKIWESSDVVLQFDKKNAMYYTRYVIATGESQLNIEAQLHSKADGWLGD